MMIAMSGASFPKRWIPGIAVLLGCSKNTTRVLLLFFLFLSTVFVANAQSQQVTGKITRASGEPLAGATVAEKEGIARALTKEDGSFSIHVSKPNSLLVISYVGYVAQEVRANNSYLSGIVM